jgi:DNA-directed RNA polymerase subunit beta'
VNELLTKKNLKNVIGDIMNRTDFSVVANFLDKIKEMGFYWSFKGGLSFNLGDLITLLSKNRPCLMHKLRWMKFG